MLRRLDPEDLPPSLTRDIAQACKDYARQLLARGETDRAGALNDVAESFFVQHFNEIAADRARRAAEG